MPDRILVLQSMGTAALAAALAALLGRWLGRPFSPVRAWASIVGVGMGIAVGCWCLGITPHWPPQEDQDRFLLILLPLIVAVEALGVVSSKFSYLVWILRLGIAAAAARVLVHGSAYITDFTGPGTHQWPLGQSVLVFTGLGCALAVVWVLLVLLSRRAPGWTAPFAIAMSSSGAALTVMLSGYATGGLIGFEVPAAVAGAMVISVVLPGGAEAEGVLGIGLVSLFSLLVMGRFFGELPTLYAAVLLSAPLWAWLPELAYIRRTRSWIRAGLSLVLTALPIAVVLMLAQQRFIEESARTSPTSQEPSIDDDMKFGK